MRPIMNQFVPPKILDLQSMGPASSATKYIGRCGSWWWLAMSSNTAPRVIDKMSSIRKMHVERSFVDVSSCHFRLMSAALAGHRGAVESSFDRKWPCSSAADKTELWSSMS